MKFFFGNGQTPEGWLAVTPQMTYSEAQGYGFEPNVEIHAEEHNDKSPANAPKLFSVKLAEGNYVVTLTLGDSTGPSNTTVKAETRRLMLEAIQTHAGETVTCRFAVNIRNTSLPNGTTVVIGRREAEKFDWDNRLTLEYTGPNPRVASLVIEPAPDVTTIFIAGDSTVTDSATEPWTGWGQMLPRFFDSSVAIANHAESGRSVRSFVAERRLEKVLSQLKRGDYVFIQFGHNDMKEKGEGVGPWESFTQNLTQFVANVRERGGLPVLITPMHRRYFNDDGTIKDTFGEYPEALRAVARRENVPLIDLQNSSRIFYETLGPTNSKQAFVYYPLNTFPGINKELKDDSHHNSYGAYVLARCVIEGIREAKLDVARHFVANLPAFDPAHPPTPEQITIPVSLPTTKMIKPQGS